MFKALELTGGDEASETAQFVIMMDRFFDTMNVHNYTHGLHARKPYQMPFISAKDKRGRRGQDFGAKSTFDHYCSG